ncbi:MAG: glycosyltransferase, partial [Actinobacteria bacterium]|nr:glycosyltransferase [Actinomycetota bacterium]
VNQAAQELPEVSFVLIGSGELARTRLKKLSNIYLLGRRKYGDLPAYLHNADVGIIPFDVAGHPELVHGVHPLKLYEYLACGLPVVSVEWEELKNINSPAILCQTADQFAQGVADVVKQPHDMEAYVRYAAGQDWSSRIKTISDFLEVE